MLEEASFMVANAPPSLSCVADGLAEVQAAGGAGGSAQTPLRGQEADGECHPKDL